jgi:hypothetical protein
MVRSALPWRQPLLFQPLDTATPFSFATLVEETRAVWFPELDDLEIETRIASLGPLASIWYHRMGWERHIIVFHPVLNHPGVPIQVAQFIAKHELTHLVERSGGHSEAFWRHEAGVGPERFAAWRWVRHALGPALASNAYGLSVRREWRRTWCAPLPPYTPPLPFDDVPFERLCPEGGAQLRFQPTWSRGPAPLTQAG